MIFFLIDYCFFGDIFFVFVFLFFFFISSRGARRDTARRVARCLNEKVKQKGGENVEHNGKKGLFSFLLLLYYYYQIILFLDLSLIIK
jgi:uncharacterized membrane protein